MKSLYEILGVTKAATKQEIKKAYRKLAMRFHPDRNTGAPPEAFHEISLAYEVLSDDTRRQEYDETGTYNPKQAMSARDQAVRDMAALFLNLASQHGFAELNYVSLMRREVASAKHRNKIRSEGTTREKGRLESLVSKIEANAIFKEHLQDRLNQYENDLVQLTGEKAHLEKCEEFLKECSWMGKEPTEAPAYTRNPFDMPMG